MYVQALISEFIFHLYLERFKGIFFSEPDSSACGDKSVNVRNEQKYTMNLNMCEKQIKSIK